MSMTKRECISTICSHFNTMPERDRDIAKSIYSQFVARGETGDALSDKQWAYLAHIAQRTLDAINAPQAQPKLELPGLVAFLDGSKLKRPRIFVDKMSITTAAKDRHIYYVRANGEYVGKIQDGRWNPRDNVPAEVADWLKEMNTDPGATMAQIGRLTSNCCYCNEELTDRKSIVWGYGPVCAKNYRLPHGIRAMSAEQLAEYHALAGGKQ